MKCLIIDTPWIHYLLEGKKTWEMRSSHTHIRGFIYLAQKKTGLIVGSARLVDSLAPFDQQGLLDHVEQHCIPPEMIPRVLKWSHAWVMTDIHKLPQPKRYHHPQGAVIWVNVPE